MPPRPHDPRGDASGDPPSSHPTPSPLPGDGEARRTRVYGILGGIASGKSAVARALAGPGGLVVSADALAHEVLESPEVQELLVAEMGPGAVGPDGRSDRAWIAERVFEHPEQRALLESWIHPRVRERISTALAGARERGTERIVLDIPLLLENDADHGYVAECDHLIFVDVSQAERERRAQETRGWKAGEVTRREAAQWPLESKRRRADYVVSNEGTLEELELAVQALLEATEAGPG